MDKYTLPYGGQKFLKSQTYTNEPQKKKIGKFNIKI